MPVLVADVGATKTFLALASCDAGKVLLQEARRYPSASYGGLEEVLDAYAQDIEPLGLALPPRLAAAVAGPVENEVVRTTNLPWVVDARSLRSRFPQTILLNDLEAAGWGLAAVHPQDLLMLHQGRQNMDSRTSSLFVILGVGTALGQAQGVWGEEITLVFPSEGGHVDFAPTDGLQAELLFWMQKRFAHVSVERLVSGMGIFALWEFFCERKGRAIPPHEGLGSGDAVSKAAGQGDEEAAQALMLFARLLGQHAGNVALSLLPAKGIFLTGGAAISTMAHLQGRGFLEGFRFKGRMERVAESIPVSLVTEEHLGAKGAATCAARRFG